LACESVGWFAASFVGRLGVWSVCWLVDRSVGLSAGRFVDLSFACFIVWLLCWLLREQITFSPASPVPIKGYFWNFLTRTILASATTGASLVGIGQLQRARCLKNTVFVCIYACT